MRSVQFFFALSIFLMTNGYLSNVFGQDLNDLQLDGFEKKISDDFIGNLEHALDMSSMKTMEEFNTPKSSAVESDESDSSITRVRREIKTWHEEVEEAQSAANREELLLKSSHPKTKSDLFTNAHQILPLELTAPSSTWKYFAVSKNNTNFITIVRYGGPNNNLTQVHQVLPERGLLNMAVFYGHVNPLIKKKFFAAGGESLSIYEIDTANPGFPFIKIQTSSFPHISSLKFVEINKITFLIFGTFKSVIQGGVEKYDWGTNVQIFKYVDNARYFYFDSVLPGSGVSDIECFTSQTKTYLIVANYRNDFGRLALAATVYEYSTNLRRFLPIQSLPTNGALDIEHFVLSNEDYVVIANEASGNVDAKIFNVHSSVYRLNKGKFYLIQTLETYGAKFWKHAPIPNCKQDVLLIYGDQRNNIDQIGIFSFSQHSQEFNAVPFLIYNREEEEIESTFRPEPNTVAAFISPYIASHPDSVLIAIGGRNVSSGSSVYEIHYEVVLKDSPLESFKRFVEAEIKILNETLISVYSLLDNAEFILSDAVLKSEKQNITGKKTLTGELRMGNATIDTLTMLNGSILIQTETGEYRADPSEVENVNIETLKADVKGQDAWLNETSARDYWQIDANRNISSNVVLAEASVKDMAVDGDLNTGLINGINLTELYNNLISRNQPIIEMHSEVYFTNLQTFRSVSTSNTINGLSFPDGFFLSGIKQTVNATKMFHSSLRFDGDLNTNKIDSIDLSEEALLLNSSATISGQKTFAADVSNKSLVTLTTNINGANFNEVFGDTFSLSNPQNVTGSKVFQKVTSNGDIIVSGLVNGIDLQQLKQKLSAGNRSNEVINQDKIFTDNVTIIGELNCQNTVNNVINFTQHVLTRNSTFINSTQHFHAEVHIQGDLKVDETVAGIDTETLITTQDDSVISGSFVFNTDVIVRGNLTVAENKTVSGIDVSDLGESVVTLDTDQRIHKMNFSTIEVYNHTIDKLNNRTLAEYQSLYNSTLHKEGSQSFGKVTFSSNVIVESSMSLQKINGHNFPEDFARTSSDVNFDNHIEFSDQVIFKSVLITDNIMGFNISNFLDNVLYKDRNEVITNSFTFDNEVTIEKDLVTNSTINGVDFSHQLFLRDADQIITGRKTISVLNLTSFDAFVFGDLMVTNTIDGVDLSDLDLSGMLISRNETITGSKCFEETDYNRSVEYVNDIDLSVLKNDIVTIDEEQIITASKTFTDLYVKGDILTSSTVNGVDLSELEKSAFTDQSEGSFEDLIIQGNLVVEGDVSLSLLNQINTSQVENVISKYDLDNFTKLVILGDSTIQNLHVEIIDQLNMSHIIYRSENRTISGSKTFTGALNVNHLSTTYINQIDFEAFQQSVVTKTGDQTINGNKSYLAPLYVNGHMKSNLVNGMDLSAWNFVRTEGIESQVVTGQITLHAATSFDKINISTINNVDLESFLDRVVLASEDYTFNDTVIFQNGINASHLHVMGEDLVVSTINGISIKNMYDNSLLVSGEQSLCCLRTDSVTVGNLTVIDHLNNLEIPLHLMTKNTSQTITGAKEFTNAIFSENIEVSTINNIDFDSLFTTTLLKSSDQTQYVQSVKSFTNDLAIRTLIVNGTVGGVDISEGSLVTLHTNQSINGHFIIEGDLNAVSLDVYTINNVSLAKFNTSRILKTTTETILGDFHFKKNLYVNGNMVVYGLTNKLNLSDYSLQTPPMTDGVEQTRQLLEATLKNQCSSLGFVMNALAGFGYRLDFFSLQQSIPSSYGVRSELFTIGNNTYLAMAISGKSYSKCADSVVFKWNTTSNVFVEHQVIPTAEPKEIKIQQWYNETLMFVLNQYAGCESITGKPLQVLFWNTTTNTFESFLSFESQSSIGLLEMGSSLHVLLSNSSIFSINTDANGQTTLLTAGSQLVGSSDLIHELKTGSQQYVFNGVFNNLNTTSRGVVKVHQYDQSGVATLIQTLPTVGLSRMQSFSFGDNNYLVIANDRDWSGDYSTYDVSVDIYRKPESSIGFEFFQRLPTYRAVDVAITSFGTQTLLAITHYEQSVSVYRFALDLGFLLLEEVHISHCQSAVFGEVKGDEYLVVTTDSSVDPTQILKLKPIGVKTEALDKLNRC